MEQQNLKDIWSSIIEYARVNLVPKEKIPTYDLVLDNSKIKKIDQDTGKLLFTVSNSFNKSILETEFYQVITESINYVTNTDLELVCFDEQEYQKKQKNNEPTIEFEFNRKKSDNILSKFTFSNYVVSDSNKLVAQAAHAVANTPGQSWSPLFIYGASGLGKTHILHAIGNKMKEMNRNISIRYIEAKEFGRVVAEVFASNGNTTLDLEKLRLEYEGFDAILVDDIQFIGTWTKAKEVFFNIFNHFINEGKQVIMTSDVYADELEGFEERFITRFSSGLMLGLTAPDVEMAKEIIKVKLESKVNYNLDSMTEEAIEYIAENFSKTVRDIEGALNRIVFMQLSMDDYDVIDLETVKSIFDGLTTNVKKGVTMKRIISVVAKYYQIPVEDLLGSSRKAHIVQPRHIAMYFARNLLKASLLDIGREFGKDHSTVMSSVKKIEDSKNLDSNLNVAIHEISNKLK